MPVSFRVDCVPNWGRSQEITPTLPGAIGRSEGSGRLEQDFRRQCSFTLSQRPILGMPAAKAGASERQKNELPVGLIAFRPALSLSKGSCSGRLHCVTLVSARWQFNSTQLVSPTNRADSAGSQQSALLIPSALPMAALLLLVGAIPAKPTSRRRSRLNNTKRNQREPARDNKEPVGWRRSRALMCVEIKPLDQQFADDETNLILRARAKASEREGEPERKGEGVQTPVVSLEAPKDHKLSCVCYCYCWR